MKKIIYVTIMFGIATDINASNSLESSGDLSSSVVIHADEPDVQFIPMTGSPDNLEQLSDGQEEERPLSMSDGRLLTMSESSKNDLRKGMLELLLEKKFQKISKKLWPFLEKQNIGMGDLLLILDQAVQNSDNMAINFDEATDADIEGYLAARYDFSATPKSSSDVKQSSLATSRKSEISAPSHLEMLIQERVKANEKLQQYFQENDCYWVFFVVMSALKQHYDEGKIQLNEADSEETEKATIDKAIETCALPALQEAIGGGLSRSSSGSESGSSSGSWSSSTYSDDSGSSSDEE
ncbi:MAG: hypothetical protein K6C34_00170 [Alphaproteobacteria bacterium]|nr:hypothetical protein [Alphaproteobacteria bacterium]